MKNFAVFAAGFVAGFATLFALMLIFGDYEETPAVAPIVVAQESAPTPLATSTLPPTPAPLPTATSTPPPTATAAPLVLVPTSNMVLDALMGAGIQVQNVQHDPPVPEGSPLPRSYKHRITWTDALLGNDGGQAFICDTPALCAAFPTYFQALAGLAGPYIYTSPNGLIVLQLNNGFTPEQAERYKIAISRF